MDIKNQKDIFDTAVSLLRVHDAASEHLSSIGLDFEYGYGFVGDNMEKLLNSAQELIIYSLGLHSEEIDVIVNGEELTLYLFVADDHNTDFAMLFDDLYNSFLHISKHDDIKELFWKAMVERDLEAKNKFNEIDPSSKIGIDRT